MNHLGKVAPQNHFFQINFGNAFADLFVEVSMVAIEIDKHFVFRQFGCATRHLPLFVDTNIGLVQFVDGIVNDDVDLSAVFKIE